MGKNYILSNDKVAMNVKGKSITIIEARFLASHHVHKIQTSFCTP